MVLWIQYALTILLMWPICADAGSCELLNENMESLLPNTRLKLGDEVKLRMHESEVIEATFLGATKEKLFFMDQNNLDGLGIQERIFWIEPQKFMNRPLPDEILDFKKQKGGSCQSFAAANCLVASKFVHSPGHEARVFAERRTFLMEMTFELIFGVKYKDYKENRSQIDKTKEQHSKIFTLLANHLGGKKNVGYLESYNIDQLYDSISEGKVAYLGAKFETNFTKVEDGSSSKAESYIMQEISPAAKERHAVAVVGAFKLKNGKRKLIVLDSGGGFLGSNEGGMAVWDVNTLKSKLAVWEKEGRFTKPQSRPYIAIFGHAI